MEIFKVLRLRHLSLRPSIRSAPHLYAVLQRDQARGGAWMFRILILLAAFVMLALIPSSHLWRVGVLGAVVCLVLTIAQTIDLLAGHWFMHLLTLQDAFDDARGRFGGPYDSDTHVNRLTMLGQPIPFDEIVKFEVEIAERRAEADQDEAQATEAAARERAEEIIQAVRTDALSRACGLQSDATH